MEKQRVIFWKWSVLLILCIGGMILLFPVMESASYARPVNDDYSFSYLTHQAVVNHTNVITAAFGEVRQIYFSWQGTYAAIFLFSLQPGIFGNYQLTTWILVLTLLIGILFFSMQALTVIYDPDQRRTSLCLGGMIAVLTFLLMIEGMPSIPEGLYWYNGAVYYTFFFSLSLILLGLLTGVFTGKTGLPGKIVAVILSVVISGGNYTTALVTLELVFLVLIYSIWNVRDHSVFCKAVKIRCGKQQTAFLSLLFVISGVCFAVSIAAPGNQQRVEAVGGLSASLAIKEAFRQALILIRQYTGLLQLLFALILVLIFLLSAGQMRELRHPIWSLLFGSLVLFLLFVSGLVPPIYGVGNIGAGRQQNIYYYSYLILLSEESWLVVCCINSLIRNDRWMRVRKGLILADMCFFLAVALFTAVKFDFAQTPTGKAAAALQDGSLKVYAAAYDSMTEQLVQAEGSGMDVIIGSIPSTPEIFESLQVEEDPEGWVNVAMARYYGLGSVRTDGAEQ